MNDLGRHIKGRGPRTAKIFIVAEVPGDMDIKWGLPCQGEPGRELAEMLREVGIDIRECYITMACKYRPPRGEVMAWIATKKAEITPLHTLFNRKYIMPPIIEGLQELRDEINLVKPNIVVALGNLALWATTGQWGIQDWRGSLEHCILADWPLKVIPSLHPSAIMRQWEWRSLAMVDFRRVARECDRAEFPEVVENFLIEPSYCEALGYLNALLEMCDGGPCPIAYDIETRAGHIACIGFAWSAHDGFCLPLMCERDLNGYWNEEEEAVLVHLVYKLMTHPNFIGIAQNASYDCQYILKHWLFMPNQVRDTLISHHATMPTGQMGDEGEKKKNPSLKKSLGVLSSIYCKTHIYWKNQLEESMDD